MHSVAVDGVDEEIAVTGVAIEALDGAMDERIDALLAQAQRYARAGRGEDRDGERDD